MTVEWPRPTHAWHAFGFGFSAGGRNTKKRTTATAPAGAAPVVSSVNKSLTRTQGGILVTLTGSNFTGATAANFGGTPGTSLTVVNDTTITVVTPARVSATYDITVEGPGGTGTLTNGIKYVNPDSIFGANLKRWYSQTYAAGVWTDESGGANTSQATAGKRPTASTLAGTTDRPATHVALDFDGTDDGLNAGGDVELFTTAGTVACIIETSTIGTDAVAVGKVYNQQAYQLGSARSVAANKCAFGIGDATDTELAVSDGTLNNGAAHVLIGVHADPAVTLYVDGTTASTDTGTCAGGAPDTADYVAIGCAMQDESTTGYQWTGKVAEVVIANVAASSTQRSELYAYLRDCAGLAS